MKESANFSSSFRKVVQLYDSNLELIKHSYIRSKCKISLTLSFPVIPAGQYLKVSIPDLVKGGKKKVVAVLGGALTGLQTLQADLED